MKEYRLKNNLIKAGFKAFAQQEYKKVSTNDIVSAANVSKGLLFHYFNNKENFYLTLYDLAWNVIYRDVFEAFPFDNRDFFERLQTLILRKTGSLQKHKTIAAFMKRVHMNSDEAITKQRLKIYNHHNQKHYKKIFEDYDSTAFRHPEHIEEIFKTVTWSFSRIGHEWEKQYIDYDNTEALRILETEIRQYVEFFKKHFYK